MSENGHTGTVLRSLADLPGRDVPVRIEIEGRDEPVIIPCRAMTFKRYQEIGRMVADPPPPHVAGPKGKIYDYQDPDYQAKLEQAREQRRFLRLAEFVQADVPGDSLQAKADWIAEHVEMGIIMALSGVMDKTLSGGGAAVDTRAVTFQPL